MAMAFPKVLGKGQRSRVSAGHVQWQNSLSKAVMVARVEPYSTVQEGQHWLRLNSHDEPRPTRVCLFWMSLVLVLHTTSVQ